MTAPFAIALLTTAVIALASLRRVPQGEAWTVHRFGTLRADIATGIACDLAIAGPHCAASAVDWPPH